jgi:hypothetical protein
MGKFIDLVNRKFGRLTVVHREGASRSGQPRWHCRCECGTVKVVAGNNLRSGKVLSCGCLRNERLRQAIVTHGYTAQSSERQYLYNAFNNAKQRCADRPDGRDYKNYRGRGITFDFSSFEQWAEELGPRPSKDHSVDRIDNDAGYKPGNVQWATRNTQRLNQRPKRNATQYTGVGKLPNGRFRACCMADGRSYSVGIFDTAEEAARAYDTKALELHGELATLNFPSNKLSTPVCTTH